MRADYFAKAHLIAQDYTMHSPCVSRKGKQTKWRATFFFKIISLDVCPS